MSVRRLLIAAAAATLLCPGPAPAADPAPPKSCASGFPWIEHEPRVRIFQVELYDRAAGFRVPYLYGCSARLRRPKLVSHMSPATTQTVYEHGRRGNRLLIEVNEYADGGGGSSLGWWDIRTGRRATRSLDNIGDADFGQEIHHAVLAPDGSIGYVRTSKMDDDDVATEYGVYHLRYANRRLAREKRVALLAPGEIDPRTLAFDGDSLTWRTRGAERTLAVPPDLSNRTATLAPPRRAHPGDCRADAGEGVTAQYLTDSLPVRLFRVSGGPRSRRGIWACEDEARVPARLVMPATRRLALTARTTRALAFLTHPRGSDAGIAGWFEPRARPSQLVRTAPLSTDPARRRRIVALAPDHTSGLALLDAIGDGSHRLTFLRAFASGFDPEAELATLAAGDIEPHTLEAAKGVLRWRAVGEARSAKF